MARRREKEKMWLGLSNAMVILSDTETGKSALTCLES